MLNSENPETKPTNRSRSGLDPQDYRSQETTTTRHQGLTFNH